MVGSGLRLMLSRTCLLSTSARAVPDLHFGRNWDSRFSTGIHIRSYKTETSLVNLSLLSKSRQSPWELHPRERLIELLCSSDSNKAKPVKGNGGLVPLIWLNFKASCPHSGKSASGQIPYLQGYLFKQLLKCEIADNVFYIAISEFCIAGTHVTGSSKKATYKYYNIKFSRNETA